MGFLNKARELEARITGKLDHSVGEFMQSGAREPLEVVHAIVEAVQEQIQSSGRGRRVFPFNTIGVTILAASRDARARFEAVVADGPPLRDRIAASLRSAGCQVDDLVVTVRFEAKPRRGWTHADFHLELARDVRPDAPPPPPAPKPLRLELTIVNGTAEQASYLFDPSSRIDLGRCIEVRDDRHRLIRTNHVAFVEGGGDVNQTVSRRHAHLAYDADAHAFRLHDDGSERGTSIVRNGRTVPVPRGGRGVRLDSGDEIVVGNARMKVKFVI
jgi:FHA domain